MRLVLLALVIATGCPKPAPTPPRALATGSGSADDFCADLGQHCGESSNAIGCCESLVCAPNTDGRGEVLVHQCVEP
ncbi:MAG: hypothetical protein WKG01_33480 [Kofleriaceae bacterium]